MRTRTKVVVIDDDPSIVGFVRTVLEIEGYEVYEALSGAMGLATVEAVSPAVVVLDVMLPTLNGLEVCQSITTDRADVAVLVFSGSTDPTIEDQARAAGASAFVAKPADADLLASTVAALVKQRRAR